MAIAINTSEFTAAKEAEIDGINFKVRPMSSSESIAWMNIGDETRKNPKSATKNMEKMFDMYFALFDKPEKAREVLKDVGLNGLTEIYQKIMEA